jgi:hypothetical protein
MLTPVKFGKGRGHAPRLTTPYVPGRRSARFWSDDELAILRAHYPTKGAAACVERLPNRAPGTIYQMATKLGLKAPSAQPKRARLGDSLDARIREMWPMAAKKGGVTAIASELGVLRGFVSDRARAMGLSLPHKKEPRWTAEEDALLRQAPVNNPKRASQFFAAHGFKRSPTAIMVRCKRQDISRRRHDAFSARTAAAVLGVDSKTIAALIADGTLAGAPRGTSRLPQQGGDTWTIEPAELRRYILDNLERIDIRKVEKHSFVSLIAQVPPDA